MNTDPPFESLTDEDLATAEAVAWSRYHAQLNADPADRDRWRTIMDEIDRRKGRHG